MNEPKLTPEQIAELEEIAPVDTGDLLDVVVAITREHIVLSPAQVTVFAVWVLHTYAVTAAELTPYLAITSAEKRSGKSRLLDVAGALVRKPWRAVLPSEAVIFRKIERDGPTLLLDEVDPIFARGRDHEGLRALLNAGFERGATVPRCVGPDHRLMEFRTFCPKALAGIGSLPDTVADRSIPIRLERKRRGDQVRRLRRRELRELGKRFGDRADRWAKENLNELKAAMPELPAELDDRAADVAEPLLAIADLAGAVWGQRVRNAVIELRGGIAGADDSVGIRLLADLRVLFSETADSRLGSEEICHRLGADETAPWADWKGRRLAPVGLARLLAQFHISPQAMRFESGTRRGYRRHQFEDAWDRYLPPTPAGDATLQQPAAQGEKPAAPSRNADRPVAGAKTDANSHDQAKIALVSPRRRRQRLPNDRSPEQRALDEAAFLIAVERAKSDGTLEEVAE